MSNIIIPSSPADQKAIKDAMFEISAAYSRIDGEKNLIKEAIDALEEKVEIPKKYLSKLAVAYHKQNLATTVAETDDLVELYETLFKTEE
jgi:hypothetical protein